MRIVYQNTLPSGEEVTIRYPEKEDTQDFLDFINELSKEETFILFQGRQQSIDEEKEFVDRILKGIEEKKKVFLSLRINNRLAGNAGIEMKSDAVAHEGLFGIALRDEYRGRGLGKLLMTYVLEESEKELEQLRIVTLSVFGENTIGRELYKKLGFKEYGWLPEGVYRKGKFDDHIFMYKKVR